MYRIGEWIDVPGHAVKRSHMCTSDQIIGYLTDSKHWTHVFSPFSIIITNGTALSLPRAPVEVWHNFDGCYQLGTHQLSRANEEYLNLIEFYSDSISSFIRYLKMYLNSSLDSSTPIHHQSRRSKQKCVRVKFRHQPERRRNAVEDHFLFIFIYNFPRHRRWMCFANPTIARIRSMVAKLIVVLFWLNDR